MTEIKGRTHPPARRSVAEIADRQNQALTRAIIVGVWGATVGTMLVWSLNVSKSRAAVGEVVQLTQTAEIFRLAFFVGTAALCVWVVLTRIGTRSLTGVGQLTLLLLPWVYLALRGAYEDAVPSGTSFLYPLLVLSFWLLRPRIETLGFIGLIVGISIALGILLAVALPRSGISLSYLGDFLVTEKALLPLGLLTGMFSSANNFGQFIALGLPVMFAIPARGLRRVLISVAVFGLIWTSSRSALAAAAIMLVGFLVLFIARGGIRKVIGATMLVAICAVLIAAPLVAHDTAAFSGRGRIWMESLDAWARSPLFGLGPGWYEALGANSNSIGSAAFHGHNQFVHTLVSGGVLYLAVTVALIWLVWTSANAHLDRTVVPLAYIVALVATCILEVSVGFVDRTNFLLVVALPMLVIIFAQRTDPIPPNRGMPRDRLTS